MKTQFTTQELETILDVLFMYDPKSGNKINKEYGTTEFTQQVSDVYQKTLTMIHERSAAEIVPTEQEILDHVKEANFSR